MPPITTIKLTQFPYLLQHIPDPPKKLWVQGVLPEKDRKLLCVVGARHFTGYGKDMCKSLIRELAGYPITIVSGLALGIDSIAHQAAMDAGLPTIAVPGSGLDRSVLYPRTHCGLADTILSKGGALISECDRYAVAAPWSFPRRNRIMAGMCDAVLVVEAEQKSGSLITAKLANGYSREVLTIPGSVFSKNSEGPHMLIKDGATPVTSAHDILEALKLVPLSVEPMQQHQQNQQNHQLKDGASTDERTSSTKNYADCCQSEHTILQILDAPKTRSELYAALSDDTKIHIQDINIFLSMLELKKHIFESGGKIHRSR
jgi:DNA processing protein